MRKQTFCICICENKDADSREADQHILCFRYIDREITLLSKSEIFKPLLQLYSLVCDGLGRKPEHCCSHDAAHFHVIYILYKKKRNAHSTLNFKPFR